MSANVLKNNDKLFTPPILIFVKDVFYHFQEVAPLGFEPHERNHLIPGNYVRGLYEKTLQRLLVVDGADGHVEGPHIVEVVISPFYFCQYAPCGYYTRINVIASHVTLCPANS